MHNFEFVETRDYMPSDFNFIMKTFLLGLYFGDSWFSEIPKDIFMKEYHKIIEILLTRSTVKVACLKEDPETILGYAILGKGSVHWVFIKKAWRGVGLAKDLVPSDTKIVTHCTKVGLGIAKKKGLIFNPFLL